MATQNDLEMEGVENLEALAEREPCIEHLTLNNGLRIDHNYMSSVRTRVKLVWMKSVQVSGQNKVRRGVSLSSGNIHVEEIEDEHQEGSDPKESSNRQGAYIPTELEAGLLHKEMTSIN